MRKVFNILVWTVVILFTLTIQGCKKEKCGCDGEVLYEVYDVPGRIYYDKETKYTWFESTSVYSFFTFCNAEEVWDDILKYDSGEEVLLSGEISDDCEKQVNYYASNKYVIRVTEIKLDEFDK